MPEAPSKHGSGAVYDAFLSYHGRDRECVAHVARWLEEQKLAVFLDQWYLVPGRPWPQELEHHLRECGAVVIFVGPGGLGPWQQRECNLALSRQVEQPSLPVIPVLLPGSELPLGLLSQETWVDLRRGVNERAALASLSGAVLGLPPGPGLAVAGDVLSAVCPYRGLQHFREEDAPFFFGREEATRRLEDVLRQKSMVAVAGSSGCGKSSVVRAGLVPALRQSPGGLVWEIALLYPTDRPLHALAGALVPLLNPQSRNVNLLAEVTELTSRLAAPGGAVVLRDAVEAILTRQEGTDRLLLVVDQWEELYTLASNEAEQRRFIDALLQAVAHERLSVVLTLRGDFFGHALAHRGLADRLQDAVVNLGPMTRSELERTVTAPARQTGLTFQSGLVDRILSDVGDEPGNLPLLEFVLAGLWAKRQGGALLHEAYEGMGGVTGAVASKAEQVFGSLTPAQREIARRILLQLVSLGDSKVGTRRRATLSELGASSLEVARKLADSRLVVTASDCAGQEETVEVSHEALIRNWERLRRWLDEDREFLLWRQRFREALSQWHRSNQDAGALLHGVLLAEAERWSSTRDSALNEEERAYLAQSLEQWGREHLAEIERTAEEVRQAHALAAAQTERARAHAKASRIARWFAAASLVAAAGLGGLAWIAHVQRRLAFSRELVANAALNQAADPELSVLLAREALRARSNEAETAFRKALAAHAGGHARTVFEGHTQSVRSAEISPDGLRVATGAEDGLVTLWTRDTGVELARFSVGENVIVYRVQFSPDGRYLAAASRDGLARVWDVQSGRSIHILDPGGQPASALRSVAFSRDGSHLVTAREDKLVTVWNASSGERIRELGGARDHEDILYTADFSPDGSLVATASRDGTVRLLDASSGKTRSTLPDPDRKAVRFAAFSPDGSWLLMGGENAQASLWSVSSGRPLRALKDPSAAVTGSGHGDLARAAAFSPDGRLVATASGDRRARLYDSATGLLIGQFATHRGSVNSVTFSPDGQYLLTASGDGTARLWLRSPPAHEVRLRDLPEVAAVRSATFNADGSKVATASEDGTARIWDSADGRQLLSIRPGPGWVTNVAFSPSGDVLLTAGGDGVVGLWDSRSGAPLRTLAGHGGWVYAGAFSPDGRTVGTAGRDGTARLWDAGTGAFEAVCEGHVGRVTGIAFAPDGKTLATSGQDGTVRTWRWDRQSCRPALKIEGRGGWACSVAIDSGGRLVAAGGEDAVTRVFDLERGEMVGEFRGRGRWIYHVVFSRDGGRLLAASEDGVARQWDLVTRRLVAQTPPSAGWLFWAEMTADRQRIVVAGDGGLAVIYGPEFTLDIESLLASVKGLRRLSAGERQIYLHERPTVRAD